MSNFFAMVPIVFFESVQYQLIVLLKFHLQTLPRGRRNSTINARTRTNNSRFVPSKSHGIHRSVPEALSELAVVRHRHVVRRISRMDGTILLRSNVFHANSSRISSQRLRNVSRQVPDQHGDKTRIPAVRDNQAGKRRFEKFVFEIRVQKTFSNSSSYFAATRDR